MVEVRSFKVSGVRGETYVRLKASTGLVTIQTIEKWKLRLFDVKQCVDSLISLGFHKYWTSFVFQIAQSTTPAIMIQTATIASHTQWFTKRIGLSCYRDEYRS